MNRHGEGFVVGVRSSVVLTILAWWPFLIGGLLALVGLVLATRAVWSRRRQAAERRALQEADDELELDPVLMVDRLLGRGE
jgi:hypothetical protein